MAQDLQEKFASDVWDTLTKNDGLKENTSHTLQGERWNLLIEKRNTMRY